MIAFKNEKDKDLILTLHPILLMIFFDLAWYAKSRHGVDLTVTATKSTPEEDAALKRTSTAHQNGLALDIRSKNINVFITKDLVEYINSKEEYKDYRYMSFSGIDRLAYLHVGSAEHIHLAINKEFEDFN
tara:strand:+ start:31807 stop:32196 length:390 start_codon:yes stop_codon:yes gene_type:complete